MAFSFNWKTKYFDEGDPEDSPDTVSSSSDVQVNDRCYRVTCGDRQEGWVIEVESWHIHHRDYKFYPRFRLTLDGKDAEKDTCEQLRIITQEALIRAESLLFTPMELLGLSIND